MGEIADALRRARGDVKSLRDHRSPPAPAAPAERDRPVPIAAPAAARVVETLANPDPAIALSAGPNAEACRQLAVRLRSAVESRNARTVAVVSAVQGEGKTTVVCDLGVALATLASGREVALVDLDLRRPSLARTLGIQAEIGLEEVLRGGASLDDARIEIVQPAFDLYPVAAHHRAAHELLALPRFAELVEDLKRRYAVVLFDTPPSLLVPDTSLILRRVELCLPIARAGQTRERHFRAMIDLLPRRQILGELLNSVRALPDHDYYSFEARDQPDSAGRGRS